MASHKISLIICIFSLSVFAHDIKADTGTEERVYILSTVWRNVRDNFAFPKHFETANPDSLFKAFLPKVLDAKSETEFSLLMTEFLAKFNDAHTRFFAEMPSATVPVKFIGIDNNVYVKNIGKQYVQKIPIGSRLVKVNGRPISSFLETDVYPYVASSNSDWKFRKSLDTFLNGNADTEVTLEFITPGQKTEELILSRVDQDLLDSYEWEVAEDDRVAYIEKFPGNIAYMRMSTFAKPDMVNDVFAGNLSILRNAKGVIFDIRGNRGGSDESWNPTIFDYIAPADKDQNSALVMKCRVSNSAFQEYGNIPQLKDFATETAMDVIRTGSNYFSQVNDSLKIKCPIIILIDGYTGSAAEDFAVTMKNLGLARLVGSHSVGVISHPRYYDLPNGYSYGLSTWAFLNPDGTGIIETGIIPDVEVKYSVNDLINKTDSQLAKAIEMLK